MTAINLRPQLYKANENILCMHTNFGKMENIDLIFMVSYRYMEGVSIVFVNKVAPNSFLPIRDY